MAYLEKRNDTFRVVFRLDGKRFSRSLGTNSIDSANLSLARVNDGLNRLKQGLLQIAPQDELLTVLLSDDKVRQLSTATVHKTVSVGKLLSEYLDSFPEDAIEANSLSMLGTHVKNLKRTIGAKLSTSDMNLAALQGFVNARSKDKGSRHAIF